MAHRVTRATLTLAVATTLALVPSSARGQCTADSTNYSIEDVLVRLERASSSVKLATSDSIAARKLDELSRALRAARAGPLSINTLVALKTKQSSRLRDVARWEPEVLHVVWQPWITPAFDTLRLIANGSLGPAMRAANVPQAEQRETLAPTIAFSRILRACATESATAKLQRYEMKYGKDSPRLNLAEVVLNYALQFIVSGDDGPSRFEAIAAYRTMELTVGKSASGDPSARMVTAAQLGLRVYNWRVDWGTGSMFGRLLRPRHMAFGAYAMDPRAVPLSDFRDVRARPGVFVGWGDVHVAYLFSGTDRVLIGTGKQLVPYAF